jgi:Kef-type K+ transport system membrane component KefB
MDPAMTPVLAAGADGATATGALADIAIMLLATTLGAQLFRRIREPAIVGQILAGVLIGPSVLGLVEPGEALRVFAELGVVFLLFWVGLETRLSDLVRVGRRAVAVASLGIAVPLVGGLALGFALGMETAESVFLAAALVTTSTGAASATLIELHLLRTVVGRTILAAAVVDDVLAMLVLAVATGLVADGTLEVTALAVVVAMTLAFIGFFAIGGVAFVRRRPQVLTAPAFAESPVLPAVLLCLGLAAIAAELGLATIIGAFLAGMIVAETKEHHPIEREVAPLYALFPPFFFGFIGVQVELGELADPDTLALLLLVIAVAIVTKLGGAWLGARSLGRRRALFVALGMVPRGEVGIIVASIGQTAGVIDDQLFAVVVAMSVATTLLVPPVLRLFARHPHVAESHAA